MDEKNAAAERLLVLAGLGLAVLMIIMAIAVG
jgi:hypothetical protein